MKGSINYSVNIAVESLVNLINCENSSDFTFMMFHAHDIQEFCLQMGMLFAFSPLKSKFIPPSPQMNFNKNKNFLTQVIRTLSFVL